MSRLRMSEETCHHEMARWVRTERDKSERLELMGIGPPTALKQVRLRLLSMGPRNLQGPQDPEVLGVLGPWGPWVRWELREDLERQLGRRLRASRRNQDRQRQLLTRETLRQIDPFSLKLPPPSMQGTLRQSDPISHSLPPELLACRSKYPLLKKARASVVAGDALQRKTKILHGLPLARQMCKTRTLLQGQRVKDQLGERRDLSTAQSNRPLGKRRLGQHLLRHLPGNPAILFPGGLRLGTRRPLPCSKSWTLQGIAMPGMPLSSSWPGRLATCQTPR